MKQIRLIMGMPSVVEIVGGDVKDVQKVFDYFTSIDERFSTYKPTSEISKINRKELEGDQYSSEMNEVFALSEETRRMTHGYFDIRTPEGSINPSGLVKGWAVNNAAQMLLKDGYQNFWVEIGGDIQSHGFNQKREEWSVGIRDPFVQEQIVKVLYPRGNGVATSGNYIRGGHIYDPISRQTASSSLVSITVIGPNVYEADRFATAAFAQGEQGILFIEAMPGLEGYAIDSNGLATMTSGFNSFTE